MVRFKRNKCTAGTLRLILTFFVAVLLVSIALFTGGCSPTTDTVTLAAVTTELNALVYIAEDQNYFSDNGIELIIKDYDSGASSATAMLNGEADIALAAEFPIVRHIFNNDDIVNLGTITKYETTFIIWRTDSGIQAVRDLKGKRVGVTLDTISEFYLGRTLELNGLNINELTIIDVKAADSEKALVNREIDAVVTWEPWVEQLKQRLGDKAVTRLIQSSQYAFWNLVSTSGWITEHPVIIERIIKALAQAEEYLTNYQEEAKAIISNRMSFNGRYMHDIWPRYQFSLSLDQSLITAMEDEARWMIDTNLIEADSIPNFLNNIYESVLKEIRPEVVNIIR